MHRNSKLVMGLGLASALTLGMWLQARRVKATAASTNVELLDGSERASVKVGSPRGSRAGGADLGPDAETGIVARSAVDTGPSTPPAEPAVPAQTWQEIYSGFSLGRVIDESRMLRAAIDEVSFSYYQDAYDRRQYEVIGFRNPGERFEIDGDEFDDLCSVTFFKDGTVARVVLPREQFPQAYEMQEKVRWLTARQDELERAPLTDLRLEARR